MRRLALGPRLMQKENAGPLAKLATCVYRLSALPVHFFPNPQPSHCTSADLLCLSSRLLCEFGNGLTIETVCTSSFTPPNAHTR